MSRLTVNAQMSLPHSLETVGGDTSCATRPGRDVVKEAIETGKSQQITGFPDPVRV